MACCLILGRRNSRFENLLYRSPRMAIDLRIGLSAFCLFLRLLRFFAANHMPKILIIEDQPQMRKNIATILEMEGFAVATAENGRRGVELARSEKPDLVLCDVMMPELDGFSVLEALRADA